MERDFKEREKLARKHVEESRIKFRIDRKSLTNEMSRDLVPLRHLIGFSQGDMGNILGVSEGMYKKMED